LESDIVELSVHHMNALTAGEVRVCGDDPPLDLLEVINEGDDLARLGR
jgi:hypothetical protein